MDKSVNQKKAELKRLEEERALITRQLELLNLIDEKRAEIEEAKPLHSEGFPIGTLVKFSNPNEKPSLKGKIGEVVGHSPKFIRVKNGKNRVLRAPNNLTPQKK